MTRHLARLAAVAAIVVAPWWLVLDASSRQADSHTAAGPPRLVGYGCEGASGPLYAAEEDHFPQCAAIEPL